MVVDNRCNSCLSDPETPMAICHLCEKWSCSECLETFALPKSSNPKIKNDEFVMCASCEAMFPSWMDDYTNAIATLIAERMDHKDRFVKNFLAAVNGKEGGHWKKTVVVYRRPDGFHDIGMFQTAKEAKHYIVRQKEHHDDYILVFVAMQEKLLKVNKKLSDNIEKPDEKCPRCGSLSESYCTWNGCCGV